LCRAPYLLTHPLALAPPLPPALACNHRFNFGALAVLAAEPLIDPNSINLVLVATVVAAAAMLGLVRGRYLRSEHDEAAAAAGALAAGVGGSGGVGCGCDHGHRHADQEGECEGSLPLTNKAV
jgi:hypothetical protein